MPHDKKHRRALYSLVIVLAVLQIASFTILSIQTSRINVKLESDFNQLNEDLTENSITQREYTAQLVETYDQSYQQNFLEISNLLTKQQADIEQEISLLKSSQDDFSGIVKDAVKSVVTVSTQSSIGSGFIIDSAGYIVTNYHVIAQHENSVRVITFNRNSYDAQLVGKDETRDIALLKIGGDFEYLKLADSSDLQVGKKVIAIGNPLGLSFTVTEGIVSALNRIGPSGLAEYVQTDVSLNPGNSGGPLIDTKGEVIGINNFKVGGAESLGFALESDAIKISINQIANETIIS